MRSDSRGGLVYAECSQGTEVTEARCHLLRHQAY